MISLCQVHVICMKPRLDDPVWEKMLSLIDNECVNHISCDTCCIHVFCSSMLASAWRMYEKLRGEYDRANSSN